MSVLIYLVFVAICVASLVAAAPQIFTDTYGFCEHEYAGKKISFPNKVHTISTRDFNLHFSFCKSLQTICQKRGASCLILKSNNQLVDLGSEFALDDESDDFTLVSSSRAPCRQNPSKNYTLSVSLLCTDSIKPKPRLMSSDDEDDCTFDVTMMKPDCRPKCTELIDNTHLLDIRGFKKNIQIHSDSNKFSLSLCGPNRDCSGGIGACEILESKKVPLASVDTQYLNYDVGKNELTARGRYRDERIVRDVQVLIKCNWASDMTNAIFKKAPMQRRHYKFELESSFGCIKLPHKCSLLSIENLHYNLSGLYKPNGWQVTGVPQGKLLINICGPLNQQKGICKDQYSQVCHIDKNNYENRGSILSSLKAYDDVITAKFISGSICRNISHSTQIEFRCSKTEKGPSFQEYKDCVTFLIWETPRACPIDFYKGQNCYMNDRVSNRNLKDLYAKTDYAYFLTPNKKTKLIYNLCGPVHNTCDGYSNVSFCLKTQQKEIVIGWDNRELISENGQLRMELQGSGCSNGRSKGEIVVHFVCDYQNPPPPTQIRVVEDGCKFNVTVFTSLACLSHSSFHSCVYNTPDNMTYDLSPLIQKSKNYIITDQNVEYVFNLCGPIVSGPGALCRGPTMFCWHNKTEFNFENEYMSMGGVAGPRLLNNTLVVEAKMGSFCEGLGYYMSVIYFECSKQKSPPVLLSKTNCIFNFKWKTPEACPKEMKCVVDSAKSDTKLDLTKLQKKIINFNLDNNTNVYKFDLCSDTYTKYSEDLNETHPLKREYYLTGKNSYLILDLQKKCDNGSTISKVFFELHCSETLDDYHETTSFEDCVLNLTLYTNVFCPPSKEKYAYSIIETQTRTFENKIMAENPKVFERNCSLTNPYTGYEFDLSKIAAEENNLNGNSTACSGIFCKTVEMVKNTCPIPTFNYTHETVTLHYSAENQCDSKDSFELDVVLKCNKTKSSGRILKDEKCYSALIYNSPEACLLLKQNIISAGNTSVIAGSVIGTLIVIFIIVGIFIYIKKKECAYARYVLFQRNNKNAVPIYTRDSSL